MPRAGNICAHSCAREGLDALIVSHPANRFYLSGFELHDSQCNESSGCLIIRQNGRDWLCTDSRYEEAAAELWDRDRIFIYRGSAAEEIRTLLRERVSCRIGFESAIVSHNFVTRLEPGSVAGGGGRPGGRTACDQG